MCKGKGPVSVGIAATLYNVGSIIRSQTVRRCCPCSLELDSILIGALIDSPLVSIVGRSKRMSSLHIDNLEVASYCGYQFP